MTYNEFKICSILFYDKFKGKNLKDVVEENKYFRPLTYSHGFNRGIQMRIAPLMQALREEVPSLKILTDAL